MGRSRRARRPHPPIVAFWLALVATDFRVLVGLLVGVPLIWYRLKREPDEDDAFDDWT